MEELNNASRLLSFAVENGILNLDDVKHAMKMRDINEAIKRHPYRIWEGKDRRWRTYVEDDDAPKKRRMIVKATEESLKEAVYCHMTGVPYLEKERKMTLRILYPDWLEFKKLHTTASTYITRIEYSWTRYYLNTEIIDEPIIRLDKLMMDEWVHHLIKDNNLTKVEYYNASIIMRQALDYAVDLKLIEQNPLKKVKIDSRRMFRKVKKKPDLTQVYTAEELKAITALAWKDFNNHVQLNELAPLALMFQFQTGLRIGELCTVRYEDIESPDFIHIQRMWRRDDNIVVDHTKTEVGDRQVLLTDTAKALIAAAKQRQHELGAPEDKWIFSIFNDPIKESVVANLYRKYCRKIKISVKSSHKARKTYISALIDCGCNINTVRQLVGHADERTTLGNYCFDRRADSEKKKLIEDALKV